MNTVPETHARLTDPDTSHAAAGRTNISEIKANAYKLIDGAGKFGMTGKELNTEYAAKFTGAEWDTPRKRISDLLEDGLVVDTGRRRNGQRVIVSSPIAELLRDAA